MDGTQQFVLAMVSIGGGMVALELIKGLVKFFTGAAGRERARNVTLKEQRNEAWADAERERDRADREAHNRRITEEYASQLRRDCTEHGMTDQELRPWPVLKKPPPDSTT
ncbi:hypothetical protein [Arthrobacter sp. FW306-2-2C-D06B]|jgi:hypothetical protein|uniref:hypothetical protein n=1 Tax=Arthrobacter sp. FW306-2-2C-D06B TaxID=2879618 RepID=UPI001F48CABC|nr:hypothetical protein [Arthrobacter sp. FW306-2-2C-D06B]UKA59148.1 hypothetical protein LFT47_01990 [Arthrobacter sp. FW306-2-2C-D06B]